MHGHGHGHGHAVYAGIRRKGEEDGVVLLDLEEGMRAGLGLASVASVDCYGSAAELDTGCGAESSAAGISGAKKGDAEKDVAVAVSGLGLNGVEDGEREGWVDSARVRDEGLAVTPEKVPLVGA